MTTSTEPVSTSTDTTRRLSDYVLLAKPRLNSLVLTTTFIGFYLAVPSGPFPFALLWHTLLGTALTAGGAAALNMYRERESDKLMRRTMLRPLPAGRLHAREALAFGLLCGLAGTVWLAVFAGGLTAALGLASFILYVLAYTPMKARSSFNTAVGALTGALPPMMGWVAVRGELSPEAWALFGILFFWQHPHFFALAWMYRRDYEDAGFRMLPAVDAEGHLAARMMVLFSLGLIPVSLFLALTGCVGGWYVAVALGLGLAYLGVSVLFFLDRSLQKARRVFFASILYLPALMAVMMLDKNG